MSHRPPEATIARVLALSLVDEIEAGMVRGLPTRKAVEDTLDGHGAAWRAIHPPGAIRGAVDLLRGMLAVDFLTLRGRNAILTPEVQAYLQDEARRARRKTSF
jgi:hypothetical protein